VESEAAVVGLWDYRSHVWDYRESTWTLDGDLVGYAVEASDGRAGTVVEAASTSAGRYLVVAIDEPSARVRVVPAGVVVELRHEDRTVRVDSTRQQLDDAPAYDDVPRSESVLAHLESYYGALGG
jgi:hypothetical protein